jgi:hypothetical protein
MWQAGKQLQTLLTMLPTIKNVAGIQTMQEMQ